MNIIDLFAGPGGWDLAAKQIGLDPVGVEWDDAAVLTRKAAGLTTVHADVAALDPVEVRSEWWGGAQVHGLIASPPCQAYSMAGTGKGREDVEHVMACVRDMAEGRDTRAEHGEGCEDERSMLVVEPLRWALILNPEWVALEQVPPVLPLWQAFSDVLRLRGYNVWAGILSSEQYGVPQTRKRAILMASRVHPVHPPEATHHAYKPGEPKPQESMDLFGGGLLPWVSMAEALGWGMTERPFLTMATAGGKRGGADEQVGGSGARKSLYKEREEGRWKSPRPVEDHPDWTKERPSTAVMGDPRIAPPGYRGGKSDYEKGVEPDSMFTKKKPTTEALQAEDWPENRPATTIAGDPRVFQPGGHHEQGQQSKNAVRVSETEAAILQGFPPDYPWQGTRTKRFQQIGNAVPPPMAKAILAALVDEPGHVA